MVDLFIQIETQHPSCQVINATHSKTFTCYLGFKRGVQFSVVKPKPNHSGNLKPFFSSFSQATDILVATVMMLNNSHHALFLEFISMFLLVILNFFSHSVSKSVPQVGCG